MRAPSVCPFIFESMTITRKENLYEIEGKEFPLSAVLDEIMRLDDADDGISTLTDEENEALHDVFSSFASVPDFTSLSFRSASSALFSYLASSRDIDLASLVAQNMGWMSRKEEAERLGNTGRLSAEYRSYWMDLAKEVLTGEGFDDYRFGSVKMDRNGTYLYDGEKAVCYIEVSREGGEERKAIISLTLLGNPEAVESEEDNRAFEWCCFFDDEIGSSDDNALILGGRLRAVDPYGPNSLIQRRYDIVYDRIKAEDLALVIKSLVRMLESYPPQE